MQRRGSRQRLQTTSGNSPFSFPGNSWGPLRRIFRLIITFVFSTFPQRCSLHHQTNSDTSTLILCTINWSFSKIFVFGNTIAQKWIMAAKGGWPLNSSKQLSFFACLILSLYTLHVPYFIFCQLSLCNQLTYTCRYCILL